MFEIYPEKSLFLLNFRFYLQDFIFCTCVARHSIIAKSAVYCNNNNKSIYCPRSLIPVPSTHLAPHDFEVFTQSPILILDPRSLIFDSRFSILDPGLPGNSFCTCVVTHQAHLAYNPPIATLSRMTSIADHFVLVIPVSCNQMKMFVFH